MKDEGSPVTTCPAPNRPFYLGDPGRPLALLLHGLTGAPGEMWPLGCGLAAAGWRVEAPLWPGHGTRPADLARTGAAETLAALRRRLAEGEPPAAVAGLSMGALLAVVAAAECREIRALVAMAPALRGARWVRTLDVLRFVPLSASLPILLPKHGPDVPPAPDLPGPAGDAAAAAAMDAVPPAAAERSYPSLPLRWARELHLLRGEARRAAPHVRCPALLIHGLADHTASPKGSLELAGLLPSTARVNFLPDAPHVLTLWGGRGAVAAEVAAFLAPVLAAAPAQTA